eukprot:711525-Rhodomonas_salina.6
MGGEVLTRGASVAPTNSGMILTPRISRPDWRLVLLTHGWVLAQRHHPAGTMSATRSGAQARRWATSAGLEARCGPKIATSKCMRWRKFGVR